MFDVFFLTFVVGSDECDFIENEETVEQTAYFAVNSAVALGKEDFRRLFA